MNSPVLLGHPQISSPDFQTDGLRFVTVKTPSLAGRGDMTLFVPEGADKMADLPVAILLHGVYGSHWAWAFQGGVHRTAHRLIRSGEISPMVLAMPSDGLAGDGTGYVTHARRDFERWIVDEVPAAVRWAVPFVSQSSKWCIGGLSMGGFGALRIASRHPWRFVAASGHSAVTELSRLEGYMEESLSDLGIHSDDRSLVAAMIRLKRGGPRIRFDCGLDDVLLEDNRRLHRELEEGGIPHEYQEFPGGHDWRYWSEHVGRTLKFFSSCLHSSE